jgi:hypothetical protein
MMKKLVQLQQKELYEQVTAKIRAHIQEMATKGHELDEKLSFYLRIVAFSHFQHAKKVVECFVAISNMQKDSCAEYSMTLSQYFERNLFDKDGPIQSALFQPPD